MKYYVAIVLWLVSAVAVADYFGYFHADVFGVNETKDHTNLVFVQAANDAQPLDQIAAAHPTAKIVFEFNALHLKTDRSCGYAKCHLWDDYYTPVVIDAVANALAPYKERIFALYIVDEIETNPPTVESVNRLISAIRSNAILKDIKLWINYDNVYPKYTRADLIVLNSDIISKTPSYGKYSGLYFLDAVHEKSGIEYLLSRANPNQSYMIIGDGWANTPDTYGFGITKVGERHLAKIDALEAESRSIAKRYNIPVLGEVVFTYTEPKYGVADSTESIKAAWRKKGLEIMGMTSAPSVTCTP